MNKIIFAACLMFTSSLFAVGPDGRGGLAPTGGPETISDDDLPVPLDFINDIYRRWDQACPAPESHQVIVVPSVTSEEGLVGFVITGNPGIYGDTSAIRGTLFRNWDTIAEIDGVPVSDRLDRLCEITKGVGNFVVTVLRENRRLYLRIPG